MKKKSCRKKWCKEPRTEYDSLCLKHRMLYQRKYRKLNKEKVRAIRRKSRLKRYYEDWKQRWRDHCNDYVKSKIKQEKIVKEDCHCGKPAQAHHDSYMPSDRLKVRWLCQLHHAEWHRQNKYKFPTKKQVDDFKQKQKEKMAKISKK